jgi:FemAB-related protein (PEP-CTERM system-associated)
MDADVRVLGASDEMRWDTFVRAHPAATPYHLTAWRSVLEEAFPVRPMYLQAIRDTEIVGVMPLVRQKSLLFGDRYTSLPFCTYGGPLAADVGVERRLLDAATESVSAVHAQYLEIRESRLPAHGDDGPTGSWVVSQRKVGVVVPSGDSPDQLLKRIDKTRRYDIRTAQKHQLGFEVTGCNAIDAFYDVFSRSMRDLGTPVYPKAFFRAIARHLGDVFGFAFAIAAGKPVAAAMIARWRDTLEVPLLGALRTHRALAPSSFLYWKLIEHASLSGLRACDFGRCTRGSGSHKFKLKFGGVERSLPWIYFLPEGRVAPSLNREESRLQLLVRAWQHLPLWLANAIGPMVASRLY